MSEIMVVYWSQTGNTEAMAEAVAEGIRAAGRRAAVLTVGETAPEQLESAAVFALGCPAMGAEVLEEEEMEPFVVALEGRLTGRKVGLFGSYGWGDGQWMRDWEERMRNAGAQVIGEEGVIAQDSPDEEDLERCRALGRLLAESAG